MRRSVPRREIFCCVPASLLVLCLAACTTPVPPPAGEGDVAAAPKLDVWAGVPPITPDPADTPAELTPAPGPKPPPRAGQTVELPFPPPAPPSKQTQDRPAEGPLKVLRTTPTEKKPGLVGTVSAVFDQPMVPLAAIDDLASRTPPMSITPTPPGKFRWLGAQMIAFEPEGRMPFSTTYTARVPAGAASETGARLTSEVVWQFTTPALEIEARSPSKWGTAGLSDVVVLRFNQDIDRARIAAALRVRGGDAEFESVPPDTWDALSGQGSFFAKSGRAERTLVLRPRTPLAPDTLYVLEIPPGVYGEGPNPSPALTVPLRTFSPLTLSGPRCDDRYDYSCRADSGVRISASSALVSDPSFPAKVRVTPEVPGLKVEVARDIQLTGAFRGLGTYTVEVDAGLRDIHGQTTTAPYRKTFTLPALDAALEWAGAPLETAILEPSHAGVLMARVRGLSTIEVGARAFGPDALNDILSSYRFGWRADWPDALKSRSWTRTFPVRDSRAAATDLPLDVRAMGATRERFLVVGARSNPVRTDGYSERQSVSQIVQITRLGITAALDRDDGVVLATDIETGEPLAGVSLALHDNLSPVAKWTGTTDAEGLARPSYIHGSGMHYLVARREGEVAYLPLQQGVERSWGQWAHDAETEEPEVFFFTERQPYKPGERVHLQGILRRTLREPTGGVAAWSGASSINYTVYGPRGDEFAKGEVKLGAFGTFSVDLAIPPHADTGTYAFHLAASDRRSFSHGIEVQDYRAPEFQVEVQRPAADTLVYGDTLKAEVRASYLHGAPLVDAEVRYTLVREATAFRPPGGENEAFTFGQVDTNRWWSTTPGLLVHQGAGRTDVRGGLSVEYPLAAAERTWIEKIRGAPPKPGKATEAPGAATYTLEASVTDDNRQVIAGRATYVVHPASEYVGVRSDRAVYRAGERARVEAVVVDVAGARVRGRDVALTLVRKETTRTAVEKGGAWSFKHDTVEVEAGACKLVSDAGPVGCDLTVDKAGSYDVKARIADPKGRESISRHRLHVHGGGAVVWQQDERRVDLVPDRGSYEPGETATLLVRSPFERARGLLVVRRDGLASHRPITVEGGTATLEIPIEEAQIPGLHASVVLVRGRVDVPGAPADQDLGRPAYASGDVVLKIAATRKKIALEVAPERTEVAPKDTLRVTLRAKDHAGAPQRAAVAVMVVDEGVLGLMGFPTPDPLAFFHRERPAGADLYDSRRFLVGRTPGAADEGEGDDDVWGSLRGDVIGEAYGVGGLGLVGTGRGGGGTGEGTIGLGRMGTGSGYGRGAGAGFGGRGSVPAMLTESRRERAQKLPDVRAAALDAGLAMSQPISLRSLFASTAYFNPEVQIDASGEATLDIPMPENLTRFRIMAVAVDPDRADRFGSGEAAVKVRKPIMLRPSLPRFANLGDRFEASVMVDNQTADPQAIVVGARGTNVVLSGEPTVGVEIPAGGSKEVRFPVAVDRVGTLRMQFAALSNGGRDATEVSLPVHVPATRQAFADYGVTADSVLRTLKVPEGALAAFGGLDLRMSSTALTGLEDAVDFLVGYRYECTEQLASRLLPIFVLGPVLAQFPIASVQDKERREALAAEGLARISSRQNPDGGFRYWDEPARSSPYLSAWVTFALLEGKRAGFAVDAYRLASALEYLRAFVEFGEVTPWGRFYDHTSRAFALWLLSREGRGAELFARVHARRKEMPLYAHAQLLAAAHRYGLAGARASLLKEFRARVVETAETAHFAERTSEADAEGLQVLMHSDVQTDAVALMALLEVAPTDPLLPKVMAGIMASRDPKRGGQWGTTHANAWALLAASRYFTAVEKEVPDYVARIWLDTAFAGERAFAGRSMATVEQQIPMQRLLAERPKQILLSKDGPGLLYYRLGLRYAPADLDVEPTSQGLTVHRSYEPLGQGGDPPDPTAVRRLPDGTWEIKAGALVRVNLTLIARDRANFVVVDDPLPAGLEGQNARFQTTLREVEGGVEDQGVEAGGALAGAVGWWFWRPWWRFDHTELRDDRALLFSDHLPAGVYTYSYTARATTIGEFALPPVRAEAMYAPEVFGHGASGKVRVVE